MSGCGVGCMLQHGVGTGLGIYSAGTGGDGDPLVTPCRPLLYSWGESSVFARHYGNGFIRRCRFNSIFLRRWFANSTLHFPKLWQKMCGTILAHARHSVPNDVFQAQNASTNLFHPAFSDYTGPDLFCSTVFIFSYFCFLFYFESCGRLSWLNCQLRADINIRRVLYKKTVYSCFC